MPGGYTLHLVEMNGKADADKLGVRLGRLCITHKVPVTAVARHMGVTRAAVYRWFQGAVEPQAATRPKIEEYISTLG
jgi:transposase-like protein